ncbi:hypothetical protein [Pseudolabrys sp.]|uniref:hypothetical protein n=1 Tax=Pseudolabrys sp. TaxID=1960880 RepID=UPI003D0DDF04
MSFSQEIKDFIAAAQAGQKILGASDDAEYKRARTAYLKATTDEKTDPTNKALDQQIKRARANYYNRSGSALDENRKMRRAIMGEQLESWKRRNRLDAEEEAAKKGESQNLIDGAAGAAGKRSALPMSYDVGMDDTGEQDAQFAAVGGLIEKKPAKRLAYADGGAVEKDTRSESTSHERARRELRRTPPVTIMEDLIGRYDKAKGSDNATRDAIRERAIDEMRAAGDTGKGYAAGGVVEGGQDATPAQEDLEPEDYVPDEEDVDTGDDEGTEDAGTGDQSEARGFSMLAANDAVRDGLLYGVKSVQGSETKSAIPEGTTDLSAQSRRSRYASVARGAGAASPSEIAAIKKAIDPEGKMPEGERNMAALGGIYQYYMNKGDPEKAQKAAFHMLQYYRQASQRYGAIAHAAAEAGDMDGATKAALNAYANIPDGRDLRVVKNSDGTLGYRMVDGLDGSTVAEGVIKSPQEIGALAMKAATDGFDQFITEAAGQRYTAPKDGKGKKGAGATSGKMTDRIKAGEEVGGAYDQAPDAYKFGESADAGKDIASNIFRTNDISQKDALSVTAKMVDPNEKVMVRKMEDGSGVVRLSDGREVMVPKNAFLQAVAIRGKALANKKATADTSERDKKLAEQDAAASKKFYDQFKDGHQFKTRESTRKFFTPTGMQ